MTTTGFKLSTLIMASPLPEPANVKSLFTLYAFPSPLLVISTPVTVPPTSAVTLYVPLTPSPPVKTPVSSTAYPVPGLVIVNPAMASASVGTTAVGVSS